MLKKMSLILLGAVCISLLSGCAKKEVVIDVDQLADRLRNEIEYKDELSVLEDGMFGVLYEIDEDDIANKKVYVSSGATAEEIAVIEAKDEEGARKVKDGLLDRVDSQKQGFESYIPEEMPKLNDPVIVTRGKYVILCISDDNEKAKEIIGKLNE